jgi:hypothetical protein
MHHVLISYGLRKEHLLMTVIISCFIFFFLCVHESGQIISNEHHFKFIYIWCQHLVLEYYDSVLNWPAVSGALNEKITCSTNSLFINDLCEANVWTSSMVFW